MFYDPRENLRPEPLKYNPFNALVAPRPIGWISTIDNKANVNLAPFSFFNGIGSEPPYVMFAIGSKDTNGAPKDTLYNLQEVPEFTVNIASYELRKQVYQSSKAFAHNVNEFEEVGLTEQASSNILPPRVAEAKAALECKVYQIIEIPGQAKGRKRHMIIGEVIGIHIDDEVIKDGKVDSAKLRQLSRLGYFEYDAVEQTFEIPQIG